MVNLVELLEKIDLKLDIATDAFCAIPIPGYSDHRLAKNKSGYPCLLISTDENSKNNESVELENLNIKQNANCKIIHENDVLIQRFTVILCKSSDKIVQEYFLKICGTLLDELGNKPAGENILKVIRKITELFESLTLEPNRSIQGIWAELFLIDNSKSTDKIVLAWHASNLDKFDFTSSKIRLEVKSCTTSKRMHYFSLEQLEDESRKVIISSLQINRIGNGKNIFELADSIKNKLHNSEIINQFDTILLNSLGNLYNKAYKERFDYVLAKDTLKFYSSELIPRITESLPSEISEVRFKVDLTNISPLNNKELNEIELL